MNNVFNSPNIRTFSYNNITFKPLETKNLARLDPTNPVAPVINMGRETFLILVI